MPRSSPAGSSAMDPPAFGRPARFSLQRRATKADRVAVKIQRSPLGLLSLPEFAPCAPTCPTCAMDRIGEVERAVREKVPDAGDPFAGAVLLVLGASAES